MIEICVLLLLLLILVLLDLQVSTVRKTRRSRPRSRLMVSGIPRPSRVRLAPATHKRRTYRPRGLHRSVDEGG
jgi:Tfp pilus assembly protein PilV